jgi:hypothetical protein
MVWSHGAGPAGMFRCTRLSPYRLTRQRSVGWAYTSLPPEFSCGEGENRLRSPPVAGVEPLTLGQQTTTGCGGGGLKTYQAREADGFQRPLVPCSRFRKRLKPGVSC